jgi:hypothetical protein
MLAQFGRYANWEFDARGNSKFDRIANSEFDANAI